MESMLVRKHEWESTTKKTSNRLVQLLVSFLRIEI